MFTLLACLREQSKLQLTIHLPLEHSVATCHSTQMKFSRPENYDPLEKGEGWTLYVGENDWEGAWTWAWVDIPTLATMIWVELEYPEELRGWVFGEPSPDDGEAKKAKAWSKAGVDLWLAGAKRYMKSGASPKEAFEDVLDKTAMKQYVRSHGKMSLLDKKASAAAPITGPEALLGALQRLDLDAHEKKQRDILKKGLVSKRDAAIQSLNAIVGLRRNGLQPADLMISKVPVIPAAFRPFTVIGNSFSPGDANELYRDLFKVRDAARMSKKLIGERPEDRLAVYDSVKALYGYGDPVQPKTLKRGVSGFMQKISGSSPKYCYDDETEILTRDRGWVMFADLIEGEAVATVNPSSLMFEWQTPHAYFHEAYSGDMYHFVVGKKYSKRMDLLVTPEHQMWFKTRAGRRSPLDAETSLQGWVKKVAKDCADMKNRQFIMTAAPGWNAPIPDLPKAVQHWDLDTLAEFIGWWLSEGSIHTCKTIVHVWQTLANPAYCIELDNLFDRIGKYERVVKYETHKQKDSWFDGWGYSITGVPDLCSWLENSFGRLCGDKRIPREILNWDRSRLEKLFVAYLKGDGNKRPVYVNKVENCPTHKNRNPLTDVHKGFVTTSAGLFSDLQELAFKLGITIRRSSPQDPLTENSAEQFVGSVIGRWMSQTESSGTCEVLQYTGKIHCCSTDNGLLVVRRNGAAVVSGNSFLQRKLLSKTQDSVARGVITVNPNLGLDEIGVPHDMATRMYAPHIQARLVRSGRTPAEAVIAIRDKHPDAKIALEREMKERPVIYSRSPAWHKFNIIAGWPKLIDGDAIHISPLVTSGAGADFDGDDQHGKIFILEPKDNENKGLHSSFSSDELLGMFYNQAVPTFDSETHSLRIVDLADFPRGKLSHQSAGQKGPIDVHMVDGVKVIAYDEKTHQPVWADVSCWSKHYQREVEIVDLHVGRQIITDDDPRAVYGVDPSKPGLVLERFTPTEALAKKVVVPFVRSTETMLESGGDLVEVPVSDHPGCSFKTIPLTWDTGYLIGAMCGDGWWDRKDYTYSETEGKVGRWNIYLSDLKGFVANRVEHVLRAIAGDGGELRHTTFATFKKDDPTRYGDGLKHTFAFKHSELLAAFFSTHMGGEGDESTAGSGNKHIPEFTHRAPRSFREGMLCGLMDTDGMCSVSYGKDKPQLQVSYSSTSLRLVRDVKFLASTLGIYATVNFSKTTTAGNSAWQTTLSAVDSKRSGLFSNLQCDWKRKNYMETEVELTGGSSARANSVVLPHDVARSLMAKVTAPKITKAMRVMGGAELEAKKKLHNDYLYLREGKTTGVIARSGALRILGTVRSNYEAGLRLVEAAKVVLEGCTITETISQTEVQIVRDAIKVIDSKHDGEDRWKRGESIYARLNKPWKEGKISKKVIAGVLTHLTETKPSPCILEQPPVAAWIKLVENDTISWTYVSAVQKTGVKEDGYDLTVPGYETFMNSDGVILSNTMNLHVPAMKDAVTDAREKLMPSKMLFSDREMGKVVPLPKHEAILGLWSANRDPAKKVHSFDDEPSALAAIRSGKVRLSDEVTIGKSIGKSV